MPNPTPRSSTGTSSPGNNLKIKKPRITAATPAAITISLCSIDHLNDFSYVLFSHSKKLSNDLEAQFLPAPCSGLNICEDIIGVRVKATKPDIKIATAT